MSALPYATICVSGPDAGAFLQAQLTADLNALDASGERLTAWCNPKGRVIFLGTIVRNDGNIDITLRADLADAVIKRLTMFRFRSKVEFDVRPSTAGDLGMDGDYDDWRLGRLRDGIADIDSTLSEQFTSHMLNLDLLGAVSLDKGCYPGQEVIARTHYRGASKRRLHRFRFDGSVASGDAVQREDRKVGDVVNVIGDELLAVVPDEQPEGLRVGTTDLEPLGRAGD